jgi:hypothetical protein
MIDDDDDDELTEEEIAVIEVFHRSGEWWHIVRHNDGDVFEDVLDAETQEDAIKNVREAYAFSGDVLVTS